MSIMQRILDLFKLPDTTRTTQSIPRTVSYTPSPKTEQYYKRESIKKENTEKDKTPIVYILIAIFVVLALVILLIYFSNRKGNSEGKEDSLWDEKEEYSSILEILSEEKNEDNV